MDIVAQTDERTAAETAWRAIVDAQWEDVQLLLRRWPDRTSPDTAAALERMGRRAAPGGDADEAMGAVHAAYGGYERVPQAVRDRLERYAMEQLGGRPWPDDLADQLRERPRYRPATRRKGGNDGR